MVVDVLVLASFVPLMSTPLALCCRALSSDIPYTRLSHLLVFCFSSLFLHVVPRRSEAPVSGNSIIIGLSLSLSLPFPLLPEAAHWRRPFLFCFIFRHILRTDKPVSLSSCFITTISPAVYFQSGAPTEELKSRAHQAQEHARSAHQPYNNDVLLCLRCVHFS